MTHLDGLILSGQWIQAIKYLRSITSHRGEMLLLNRAVLLIAVQANRLGILDGAPTRITQAIGRAIRTG